MPHKVNLNNAADEHNDALYYGPLLHIMEVILKHIEVSGLRTSGHLLELSHYLNEIKK